MSCDVSVIIPCYNEKNTILPIVERIRNIPISKEIIVICDGSTDGTRELLKEEERKTNSNDFKIICHSLNKGKGASIKTGIAEAKGKIVITQDADLELNPEDYLRLLQPFNAGAQVVFGSRFSNGYPKNIPFYSCFANWVVTFLANFFYNANITDEACGYKIMSLELYRSLNLESNGFDICPEITAKVCKRGYKIHEVPVQFNPRSFSAGKKIHWKHGFQAVWKLIKYRFLI